MHGPAFQAAAALALVSSGPLLAAQTQAAAPPSCLTNAEMHGLVGYFLPNVLHEVSAKCRAALSTDSFLRTRLPQLSESFRAERERAWPQAKAAFLKLGGGGEKAAAAAQLSDEALRAMVDDVLGAKMSFKLDVATCGEVNDILEALAPLDREQLVHLVATVFNAAARKDRSMRSCPRGS